MKEQRQSKILDLIKTRDIETQEELAESLEKSGFKVTQATISRDIRELKLTKVTGKNKLQKYVTLANIGQQVSDKVIRVFKAGFLSMEPAQNILVVRTLSGMGGAVAAAIDAFAHEEVVGTLAGDDTIFCAIREQKDMEAVIQRFQEMLNS